MNRPHLSSTPVPDARALSSNPKGTRVLLLGDTTFLDEDAMHLMYLADGLRKGGMHPLVAMNGQAFGNLLDIRQIPWLSFSCLAWGPAHPFQYRAMLRAVQPFDAQIVHVTGRSMASAGSWIAHALKVPLIISLPRQPSHSHWKPPANTAKVLLPGQAVRTAVVHRLKIPAGLCQVVPPGIDVDEILEPEEPMVGGYPTIAIAGRLEFNRGLRRYIHLASRLLEMKLEAEFLLVGEGPQFRKLRHAVITKQVANRVTFLQAAKEWPDIFRICTLSVCIEPDATGFLPILLSMGAGCPVIASGVPITYDFLEDGKTGILVDPDQENGFLESMKALIRDPMRAYKMGLAARKQARERFPMKKMIDAIRNVYQSAFRESATVAR